MIMKKRGQTKRFCEEIDEGGGNWSEIILVTNLGTGYNSSTKRGERRRFNRGKKTGRRTKSFMPRLVTRPITDKKTLTTQRGKRMHIASR